MIVDKSCIKCKKEFLGFVPEWSREEYYEKNEGLCAKCRQDKEFSKAIKVVACVVFAGTVLVTPGIEYREYLLQAFRYVDGLIVGGYDSLPSILKTFLQVGICAIAVFMGLLMFVVTAIY